jgi:two-component SAPR family response regulator
MRTLIVEDEAIVARQLEQTLTEIGHEVVGAAMRTGEAVRLLDQHGPEIALIDIVLKSTRDGVDLAHIIRDQYGVPFI